MPPIVVLYIFSLLGGSTAHIIHSKMASWICSLVYYPILSLIIPTIHFNLWINTEHWVCVFIGLSVITPTFFSLNRTKLFRTHSGLLIINTKLRPGCVYHVHHFYVQRISFDMGSFSHTLSWNPSVTFLQSVFIPAVPSNLLSSATLGTSLFPSFF